MANIKKGSIVSDIRGRVGSEIYSRNREGSYVKSYVVPVQPNTGPQLNSRNVLTQAVSAWQALSDSERLSWIELAGSTFAKTKLGDSIERVGYNTFIERKMNLLFVGSSSNPFPFNHSLTGLVSLSFVSATTSSISVNLDEFSMSSRVRLGVFMSPAVSSGIMSPNSTRFSQVVQLPSTSINAFNFKSSYESVFGSLSGHVGDKIFMKVKARLIDAKAVSPGPTYFSGLGTPVYYQDSIVIT